MNKYILGDCMSNEKEIFKGKTFQDLTKDIYENTTKRKTQIDLLISEIHGFIEDFELVEGEIYQFERLGFARVEEIKTKKPVKLVWLHN